GVRRVPRHARRPASRGPERAAPPRRSAGAGLAPAPARDVLRRAGTRGRGDRRLDRARERAPRHPDRPRRGRQDPPRVAGGGGPARHLSGRRRLRFAGVGGRPPRAGRDLGRGARRARGPRRVEGALLPRLVGPDRLVAANSLNALNNNLGRLVGPALGGVLYAWGGLGGVVLADAATFLGSAALVGL
ncbi:MAG: hypothetical protein AVDCRST_MAG73-2519, partial [uncultured Thermomicrobiales bacterium]